MFIPITVETNKSDMLKCTISYCSDFNRLEPMQKCTTYDLVAVITHHGNVGGKINLFIGLRQLCPKWTPLGPELSVGLRKMSISYRKSNKGSKERQGSALGVRFSKVSYRGVL